MDETVQPGTEGLELAGKGISRPRRDLALWLRRGAKAAAILVMIPLVLTLLYLPPFVRPVSTLMLADLVTLQGYDRRWVPLEDISPVLINSVIMSEDGQFCRHLGIDFGELRGVVSNALAGEPTRGASTITMQTVKNLFLWNGRSIVRKVVELPLAAYFDLVVPKWRIMEIYLNIAEWGPGIYGIEAAAQHHFGVSAKQAHPAAGGPACRRPAQSDHPRSGETIGRPAAAGQPHPAPRRAVGRLCSMRQLRPARAR